MREAPADGPIGKLWAIGGRLLLAVGIWGRNRTSLDSFRRLLVEDGAGAIAP